jgi:hypothetical protein
MGIWEQAKEATTVVVGLPLAVIAVAVATIGLVFNWIGVSVIERVIRQR